MDPVKSIDDIPGFSSDFKWEIQSTYGRRVAFHAAHLNLENYDGILHFVENMIVKMVNIGLSDRKYFMANRKDVVDIRVPDFNLTEDSYTENHRIHLTPLIAKKASKQVLLPDESFRGPLFIVPSDDNRKLMIQLCELYPQLRTMDKFALSAFNTYDKLWKFKRQGYELFASKENKAQHVPTPELNYGFSRN